VTQRRGLEGWSLSWVVVPLDQCCEPGSTSQQAASQRSDYELTGWTVALQELAVVDHCPPENSSRDVSSSSSCPSSPWPWPRVPGTASPAVPGPVSTTITYRHTQCFSLNQLSGLRLNSTKHLVFSSLKDFICH